MIYVGLDDTDTLDTPGTNQLARHLAKLLADRWFVKLISRHQLLEDLHVPCTRRNGCVAMICESRATRSTESLIHEISAEMQRWCPEGSDPGLCIAENEIPAELVAFGQRCQQAIVTQAEARGLARKYCFYLRGLKGTEDGVIGALAAVGLASTANSGRVIMVGHAPVDHYDVAGIQSVEDVFLCGVEEIRRVDTNELVSRGRIELGKRLRPNMRQGKIVLYVLPSQKTGVEWDAQRLP